MNSAVKTFVAINDDLKETSVVVPVECSGDAEPFVMKRALLIASSR
jgi:hypothetical protein